MVTADPALTDLLPLSESEKSNGPVLASRALAVSKATGVVTLRTTFVLLSPVALVALTARVKVPVGVDVEVLIVSTVLQVCLQELREKEVETPCGRPDTEKFTSKDVFKVAVMFVIADAPGVVESVPPLESEKLEESLASARCAP